MIDINQLKPFILSPNEWTRREVVHYFGEGWLQDAEIWPLVLQACDSYGLEHNRLLVAYSEHQLQSRSVLDSLVSHLEKNNEINTLAILGRVIAQAPLDLLAEFLPRLRSGGKMFPEHLKTIDRRTEVLNLSPEVLWEELQAFARRNKDAPYATNIDYGYATGLIEALARYDLPDEETVCRLLEKDLNAEIPADAFLELFLIDLAGARKIEAAVPLLVDRFKIDTDFMLERCNRALARIGSSKAVLRVREAFAAQSWSYQLFASGVFSNLKCPESEQAVLALREEKNLKPDIRERLCDCLCDQFSLHAVDWGRELVAAGQGWEISDLRERLLVLAEVHNVDFPEREEWHVTILEKEKIRLQRQIGLLIDNKKVLENERQRFETEHQLLLKKSNKTVLEQGKTKIGPNTPCPCGSNKKYKKCCGRFR